MIDPWSGPTVHLTRGDVPETVQARHSGLLAVPARTPATAQTLARTGGRTETVLLDTVDSMVTIRRDGSGAARKESPARHGRWRPPARVLIMGWVMLLMLSVLVIVNFATRQILLGHVDERVTAALLQEREEFEQFARVGVDPDTGRQFEDVYSLVETHLHRQSPDDDEILFGVVEDPGASVARGVRTGVLRQFDPPPYDVSTDPELRDLVLRAAGSSGRIETPAGELRFLRVPTEPPAGSRNPAGTFVIGYFVDRDRADVDDAMRTLVLVSVAGLVLAGIGAWLVSGQILAPVRLVRQAAAEITEADLSRRIPVNGRDDISALSEQFNAMLDRLESAFSGQRQFIDDASHELRTPITIVRGHLEVMGDDPAERAAAVRIVTDELDRMSRIVEDLLLLAKSQRPDFVRPEPTSVAELTSDVDAKVRALGDRRWRLDAIGEGTVWVDAQRVTQAMVQLAHNAVQYTAPGDEIRIGSAAGDDTGRVSFWVTDQGPGVRPEDAESIFERFSRGSTGPHRGHRSGAGLGLAIVRAIAAAHSGTVGLDSEPGRGATFRLDLPARPGAAPHRWST
jgi:two-component system, OmpR family, sensor kinase